MDPRGGGVIHPPWISPFRAKILGIKYTNLCLYINRDTLYNFSPSPLKMWILEPIQFGGQTTKMQILKILQRKNQGFCPSVARQKLTVAPIDLNSFLKGPQWTFVKSH